MACNKKIMFAKYVYRQNDLKKYLLANQVLHYSCTIYVTATYASKWKNCKENQMRSPDLEFRLKNRIFDLDRLRDVESIKFWSKSWRNNQNLKNFKAKFFDLMVLIKFMESVKYVNSRRIIEIYFLRIIKWKNFAFKKFQILIVSSTSD